MNLHVLSRARRMAERLMVDQCIIRRQTGPVTDPVTAKVSPAYSTIYTGQCKVQSSASRVQEATSAEHQFAAIRSEVHLPMTAGPVQTNDYVTITASLLSPPMVGMEMRVTGVQPKSFETVQRVLVEVLSA